MRAWAWPTLLRAVLAAARVGFFVLAASSFGGALEWQRAHSLAKAEGRESARGPPDPLSHAVYREAQTQPGLRAACRRRRLAFYARRPRAGARAGPSLPT